MPDNLPHHLTALWCFLQNTNENESDKIVRLQAENDSLSLQASILTDQIELQTEKLQEIETQLNEAMRRLEGADARLQEVSCCVCS